MKLRLLGAVCDVIGGGTPSKKQKEYYGGDIPWATVRDMGNQNIVSTEHSITLEGLNASSSKVIPSGEVVIATRVGLGKVCMLQQDTAINQDLRGIIPRVGVELDRRYLFYWFQSIAGKIISAGTGATVQGVKLPFVKSLLIPLPPLEEQKHIVAVLDEAFEGLETARANAEANLKNAEELFQSSLNYVFIEFLGIDEQMLETIVEKGSPITYGVVKPGKEGDVLFVRGGDLKNGVIAIEELRTITKEVSNQYKRTELRGGEVLLCLVGQPGQTGVVPDALNGANIARQTALIRPKTWYENRFLSFFLLSPHGQARLGAKIQGAIQQVINLKDVREIEVPCPSYEKQKLVSDRLTVIQDEYERFKHEARLKKRNIEELRQSLLQKAFAGDLT